MMRFFLSGLIQRLLPEKNAKQSGTKEPAPESSSPLRDLVLLGGIAGVLGHLARDIWSYFAKQLGLAKFYIWQRTADLFIDGKEIHSFFGTLVGILGDIVFGAVLGVTFVYFLKFTNAKNIIIKGWGMGMASWLLLYAILLGTLPGSQGTAPKDALSNVSAFIGHSIFGITLGIFVQILLKRFGLLNEKHRL